jgi:hypothetical protein
VVEPQSVAIALAPQFGTDHGTHLGGFTPALRCGDPGTFRAS